MNNKRITEKVNDFLLHQPKTNLSILGFLLLIIVSTGDYVTGNELVFTLFYLLPIGLFSWYIGMRAGLEAAILSEIVETIVSSLGETNHKSISTYIWNFITITLIFAAFAYVLSKLKNASDSEKTLARTDALTGISNRQGFFELAKREIDRAKRYDHPITTGYIDCDNFKFINDSFGHHAGDLLLIKVASTIQKHIRVSDLVCRLGGDEFAILLPETGFENARTVFTKIHDVLLQEMQKKNWPVTFSIGIITFIKPVESLDEMLSQADKLMYQVKKEGKNSIKYKTA